MQWREFHEQGNQTESAQEDDDKCKYSNKEVDRFGEGTSKLALSFASGVDAHEPPPKRNAMMDGDLFSVTDGSNPRVL